MSVQTGNFAEMSREEQLLAWNMTQQKLAAFKEQEMTMRKHIVESNSQGIDPDKIGTQNVELGNGWKLKAVIKDNYTLDTDNEKVEAVLDTFEDWQAERLVKWSGRMMKTEYDALDDAQRERFNEVVTIKRASPTLTLVAPKAQ